MSTSPASPEEPNQPATSFPSGRPATSRPGATRYGGFIRCAPNACISAITPKSFTADVSRVNIGRCRGFAAREGKMDLSAFYGAFSPACFALLGLWLVAVQIRLPIWKKTRNAAAFLRGGAVFRAARHDERVCPDRRAEFSILAGVVRRRRVRRRRGPGRRLGLAGPARTRRGGGAPAARRRLARPGRLPGGDRALRSHRGAGRAGRPVRAAHRGGAADPAGLPRLQRGVAAVAGRQEAPTRPALG